MENNYGPNADLRILLNKPYLADFYLKIVKDAKKSRRNMFRTASKTGSMAKFGRIGIIENKHNKKKGKWGNPK